MPFNPTPEQLAIVSAAQSTEDNLIISALAGAAKTSTLVLIAEALPKVNILCLAFNKRIADEMSARLPPNCTSMTLNSLGFRVWKEALGRGCKVDKDKGYNIMSALIAEVPPEMKSRAFEGMPDYLKAVATGKQRGYVPDGYGRNAKPLFGDDDFFDSLDDELEDWEMDIIREATRQSLDLAWQGTLDFDDQILMPTLFPAVFPRYPLVLIDEAQDLSPLNHATLRKLAKRRLIAVGDECQAIYGFRGAANNSMELLEREFSMRKLMLSVSFRCPISIVEHARWRAPHMQYPAWAKAGEVAELQTWEIADLQNDAAVICRNNAPIFSLAMKMLIAGRYAQIMGNDIGKGLLKVMKKFGPSTLKRQALLDAIADWEEAKVKKTKSPGPVRDRAECMRIFARQGSNLGDALAYAEHIFNSNGPIKLMTGHKSKGLEFDHVYILEQKLLRDEGQDKNLKYVMQTRAKETLTYIDFEGLIMPEQEGN
jgi:DNA helicase-2/ATP-dependent DNA helicase PcrA